MPWIQLQARRDTNFTINRIRYDFYHVTLHQLDTVALHNITLAEKSDDVTLSKTDAGLLIGDIAQDESAWLKLPDIDAYPPAIITILKITATKISLWLLICIAFIVWAPGIRQEN